MPVIGRLDEQVDAVLINPLSNERRREPETTPAADAGEPRQQPSQIPATNDATNIESPAKPETLPVWLL